MQPAELTPTQLVLAIIRENGLIVLALISLLYQSFILLDYSKSQQSSWRETIDSLVKELTATREQRVASFAEADILLTQIRDVSITTQKIVADMEERNLQCRKGEQ